MTHCLSGTFSVLEKLVWANQSTEVRNKSQVIELQHASSKIGPKGSKVRLSIHKAAVGPWGPLKEALRIEILQGEICVMNN